MMMHSQRTRTVGRRWAYALGAGLVLAAPPAPIYAKDDADQKLQIEVSIDQEVVELGQIFRYEIHTSMQGRGGFQLMKEPDFGPFSVIQRAQIPQFIISNGVATHSLTLTYQLRTRRLGEFEIAGPVLKGGERQGQGRTIKLKVVEPGKAPKPKLNKAKSGSAFMEARYEPQRAPYVGEQITLAYDLYLEPGLMTSQSKPPTEPSLDSFWVENLSSKSMGTRQLIMVDGRPLERIPLAKYAVFPLKAGPATIDPIKMELITEGFFAPSKKFKVESDSIKLEVKPLPPEAPTGFEEGNIGQWNFLATTSALNARQGRPITIRISAQGTGQVDRLRLPKLPEAPELYRITHSEQDVERELRHDKLMGTKTVTYSILPLKAGELLIPALSFSYFDPEKGHYQTKQSGEIRVQVQEGEVVAEVLQPRAPLEAKAGSSTEAEMLSSLRAELKAPLAASQLRLARAQGAAGFVGSWLYWLLVVAPVLGLAALGLGPRLMARLGDEREPQRLKRLLKEALAQLELASQAQSPEREELVSEALRRYLIDALGLPAGATTGRELPNRLKGLGVKVEDAELLGEVINQCNRARYASAEDKQSLALTQLRGAIDALKRIGARQREPSTTAARAAKLWLLGAGLAAAAAVAAPSADAMAQAQPEQAQEQAQKQAQAETQPAKQDDAPKRSSALEGLDDAQLAQRAEAAQGQGKWAQAVSSWRVLSERHPLNAEVLYNLGTSAIHADELATARLALERAAYLAPNKAQMNKNLDVVTRMIHVRALEQLRGRSIKIGAPDAFAGWNLARRISETMLGVILLAGLWTVLVCALLRRKLQGHVQRDTVSVVLVLALTLAIGAGLGWMVRQRVIHSTHPAIVMVDGAIPREGPSALATKRMRASTLIAGVKINVEEQREGWLKVRLPDESTGWLPAEELTLIVPTQAQ